MSPSQAEEIDALYTKFVLGKDPTIPASASPFTANVFLPAAPAIAAFAARFGLTVASLSGDAPEQQAVAAKDPSLNIPWPRIAPLPTPLVTANVEEYAGEGFLPDGTHTVCSKTKLGQWRHVVELLAAPECNTADAANKILTGAGDSEPKAVCLALLTGQIDFPQMGSPSYRLQPGDQGDISTEDGVIAKLTAIPAPALPYDPNAPGPGGKIPH
jgi:hypothetical protein